MQINPSIFTAYDVRGIYPTTINEEVAAALAKAIYTFFAKDKKKPNLSIVLGRDMRISSPSLFEIIKKNLVDQGATVIDIGLAGTTTVYFTALNGGYDAGIQVSASHNPKDYAGLKFFKTQDNKIVKISKNTGMDEIKRIALNDDFAQSSPGGKVVCKTNALEEEVNAAIKDVTPTNIKKLKIVADAANAMGALMLDELFKKIPGDLTRMNFTLDGTFPAHQADPLQFKTLESLQAKVLETGASLGIAPDGDGDRIFFIDETGKVIPATLISSLVAKEIIQKQNNKKIIVDIRYTRNVINVCQKYGGQSVLSKVGHSLITQQLNQVGAAFAGESSGHFYFSQTGGAESSVRMVLYVLEVMSRENKPISQLVAELQTSIESGELNFLVEDNTVAENILTQVMEKYKNGQISRLDGLSIDFPEWRLSIRKGNTEPLLRLNIEGKTNAIVNEKVTELKDVFFQGGARIKG